MQVSLLSDWSAIHHHQHHHHQSVSYFTTLFQVLYPVVVLFWILIHYILIDRVNYGYAHLIHDQLIPY